MMIEGQLAGNEKLGGYATGGRATTASIFGEAGAEWAIPEAHTNRTAELLNAARAASGFSWAEIMQKSGSGSNSSTIVYSPTINTGDTAGLEAALANDKVRLERWWKSMKQRDRMVTFA